MTVVELHPNVVTRQAEPREKEIADLDIVSFCRSRSDLLDLAYALADHGHIYIGEVIKLNAYTVLDLADGRIRKVRDLERMLVHHGLHFDLILQGWAPPQPLECILE